MDTVYLKVEWDFFALNLTRLIDYSYIVDVQTSRILEYVYNLHG